MSSTELTGTRFINLIERNLGESPSKVVQQRLEVKYCSTTKVATATVGCPESTLYLDRTSGKVLKSLCKHLLKGHNITEDNYALALSNVVVLDQVSIRMHSDVKVMHSLYLPN